MTQNVRMCLSEQGMQHARGLRTPWDAQKPLNRWP